MDSKYRLCLYLSLFSIWGVTSAAAPSLQQTVPSAGISVCLHSTVEFTCIAEDELRWREVGTPSVHLVTYMTSTGINQTGTTGVFRTVLTDISGNTLTSTAAIDSVSLSDDGRTVECRQTASSVITDLENTIQVEGPPPAPTSLTFSTLSSSDTESSVNLTWSLDNQCVVVYHVEVTNINTSNITNMNTTSQYIVLTLQTGVVYSFRVRGADSAGRGNWSEQSLFTPGFSPASTILILSTASTFIITTAMPTSTGGLQAGAIAGIVVGIVVVVALVLIVTFILLFYIIYRKTRPKQRLAQKGTDEQIKMANTIENNQVSDSKKGSLPTAQPHTSDSKKKTDRKLPQTQKNQVEPAKETSGITYAELELSGGSGASGSSEQRRETVKQDVNYEEIDHDRMNALNSSHPPQKPPHQKRGGTT